MALPISTVTHSRSYSPCSFAPALPTASPQVESDQTTSRACSLQPPAAGQPCASPSHWQMKRRGPPRPITIPRIIKVMLWSVMIFLLSPSNWIGKKKVADIPGRHTQYVTVDDNDDPNFDPTVPVLEDESPYPEVRCAVANTDDPTMPSSTFRAWVVGLILAVLIPGVNQFFFRYPSVIFNQVCETFSPRRFSLPFGVPVSKSNPTR
jgi:hypothetical protein